jgi:chromosome segregation ATPase
MENLNELLSRIQMLETLENRISIMQNEIRKAEDEVAGLRKQYEQEHRDVEQMQKSPLSAFLLKLADKCENKLEIEQREEIEAKLALDRALTRLYGLKQSEDELSSRISALRCEKRTYQSELAIRCQELADMFSEPEGARYKALEAERNSIISRITEIKEALGAAARAKSTAKDTLKFLEGAEEWATYDIFTHRGIFSHMAKYSQIDSAVESFHRLLSQLRDLKSELNDVQGLTASGLIEISSSQRTVDFWFDNIFTDLSVRGQIKDNAEKAKRLLSGINSAEAPLKSKLQTEEAKLAENMRMKRNCFCRCDNMPWQI